MSPGTLCRTQCAITDISRRAGSQIQTHTGGEECSSSIRKEQDVRDTSIAMLENFDGGQYMQAGSVHRRHFSFQFALLRPLLLTAANPALSPVQPAQTGYIKWHLLHLPTLASSGLKRLNPSTLRHLLFQRCKAERSKFDTDPKPIVSISIFCRLSFTEPR